MSLEAALQKSMGSIPECLAAGYVDMSTGMLLGVKTLDSHPQEVLDLVAAATAEMFQGSNVTAIEQMFNKSRGLKEAGHHYFQEMVVFSDNLLHMFARCKQNEDHVIVFVCRKSANVGMVIAKSRMSMKAIEASL